MEPGLAEPRCKAMSVVWHVLVCMGKLGNPNLQNNPAAAPCTVHRNWKVRVGMGSLKTHACKSILCS